MEDTAKTWFGFRKYLKFVWKEKKSLYLYGILFFPAFIAANYFQVYLPGMVIQELEEGKTITFLGISTLAVIAAMLVCIILRVKMMSKIEYGNRMLTEKMQNEYTRKMLYIDYRYLEDKEFLSIRNKTKESLFGGSIGDAQRKARLVDFMNNLCMVLTTGGNILFYSFYLYELSPWLLLILVVMLFQILFVNKVLKKYEIQYAENGAASWQKLDYVTRKTEDFTMAKDIRLYQMDVWLSGLVGKYDKERMRYKKKELRLRGTAEILNTAVYGLYYGLFFYSVLNRMWEGSIGVSDVVFYAGMGPALYHMASRDFYNSIFMLLKISIGFSRFQEYMDYGEDTGQMEVAVKKEAPVISLEHVSFSYPGSSKTVLQDLNLTIPAGEKLAIVGVNGAGKTTLMKLICGLLHPTEGRILLNGTDMEEMEAEERYAWFSCTFQDVQFLPFSIRENISMQVSAHSAFGESEESEQLAAPESSMEDEYVEDRIWECLRMAGMEEDILQLPEQLDTVLEKNINENATDFSGGQRQKLILARALYRNAGVLILDEPTAALDALAENDIYEKYAGFAENKTSFFVSHRLSSTRFCDRILLINGGRVEEEGTHEELLAAKGLYAQMFAVQSRYYKGVF